MAPNLAPNKFEERLSGASRMQENLSATGAMPRTGPHSPSDALAGGEEAGCPRPVEPHPGLDPMSLGLVPNRASPLSRNRRLGPSQHDGLDAPMSGLSGGWR